MKQLQAAQKIFRYLYIEDNPVKSDIIMGFGHFDMNIARRCATLFSDGYASKIVFTGGVGAGTADLVKPEAQAFRDVVLNEYPGIRKNDVLVEDKSTNTGENIVFTNELLKRNNPEMQLGKGDKKVLIVASPFRQKRVWLTCKKNFPGVTFINVPPVSDFENETALFAQKNRAFIERLIGELNRLINYPQKGLIAHEAIPIDIMKAYKVLNNAVLL